MSTIETNLKQEEFDPDSLLGIQKPEQKEKEVEHHNFCLEYSTLENSPTSDNLKISHKFEAYAFSFKIVKSESFEIKFKTSFEELANIIISNSSKKLKINKMRFHDLKIDFPNSELAKKLLEITYVETSKSNRTGIATIVF